MPVLEKIFNPVSDTFLVLEASTKRKNLRYSVYRQARSPEFMIEKNIHSGVFSFFDTKSQDEARKVYEQRLVSEAGSSMYELCGYKYRDPQNKSLLGKAFHKISRLDRFLMRAYGGDIFHYEICDPSARKLYAFERKYFGYPSREMISTRKARELVDQVSKDYKLFTPPSFLVRDHKVYQRYLGDKREILGHAALNFFPEIEIKRENKRLDKRIVLHEMAHVVMDEHLGSGAGHGPLFAMVATQLYDRYFGISRKKYFDLANNPEYMIFGPKPLNREQVLNVSFVKQDESWRSDIFLDMLKKLSSRPCSPAARSPA